MMTAAAFRLRNGTLAAAVFLLASCEKAAMGEGPQAPETPPTSGMDIAAPLTARGTEPFWALHITDGTKLRLTRPDLPDLTAQAPGAAVEPGRAVWVGRTEDGRQITVSLYTSDCSDGMSDLKYPMAAEVVLPNERLSGCAAKTAELPREGG